MASCNLIELFSFGSSDRGENRVVSTTGDTGGSCLIVLGERGNDVGRGSGEVEVPGVGSCECSSLIWDEVVLMEKTFGCDWRVDSRALNLHHMRTCAGSALRPSAQRSYGGSVAPS